MFFSFFKKSLPSSISFLVLWDIASRYWVHYLVLALMSALSFVLQIVGMTTLVSSIRGTEGRFAAYIGTGGAAIALAFVVLVVSAVCMLLSRILSVRLMVAYESYCGNRLVKLVRQGDARVKDLSDAALIRYLSKDCRFGGRIVQELSGLVMPAGIAAIALPMLLYLNHPVTLLIIAVLALSILPYKHIAKFAKMVSYAFETSAGQDGKYKKDMLGSIRDGTLDKKAYRGMPHPEFKRRYAHRLIVAHSGVFLGGLQLAVCLLVVSVWFNYRRHLGEEPANLVMYAFVAVLAFSQMRAVPKVVANFNVFLAYFQRVFAILHGLSDQVDWQQEAQPQDSEDVLIELDS